MDPYRNFKALSQILLASSQNVPFPAGLALEGMARLILVITAFMEMEETERHDRQRAERLLQRAIDISNLILCHEDELRRPADQQAINSSFILRFMSTIEAIEAFVSEMGRCRDVRKGIKRYLVVACFAATDDAARQEWKQLLDEYWKELDSLHLEFQSYLVSNKAAKGPHLLIKHPDIRLFWKYRLTNALEVPWGHFWCHFLDEYPLLKNTFLTKEGPHFKHTFETLAKCEKNKCINPEELNKIFQPISESVETIVYKSLQVRPGLANPTHSQDIVTLEEVQTWKGFWVHDSHRGKMELEICVIEGHQVFGSGTDEIERFSLQGTNSATCIHWKKQYINGHVVNYHGLKFGGSKVHGNWSITPYSDILKGHFFLQKVQSTTYIPKPLIAGNWSGFYMKLGKIGQMKTVLIFTHTYKIHGEGFDNIGHYTWCGTFALKEGEKEVSLTKQYYQAHSVHYHGMVREITSIGLVMKGTWSILNDCEGNFELRTRLQ